MPIAFDLEQLRKEHDCKIYFETGLWDPRGDISCKKALQCSFDRVYCVEIRDDWVDIGKQVFAEDIAADRLRLIRDDSTNMMQHIKQNPDFAKKTMFFLDAHVDNDNIHGFKKRCPLFEELHAIQQLHRKDNVILIDDLRILAHPFPWCEESYGDINFVDSIVRMIMTINPEYKFKLCDGHIPNDVLLAYV